MLSCFEWFAVIAFVFGASVTTIDIIFNGFIFEFSPTIGLDVIKCRWYLSCLCNRGLGIDICHGHIAWHIQFWVHFFHLSSLIQRCQFPGKINNCPLKRSMPYTLIALVTVQCLLESIYWRIFVIFSCIPSATCLGNVNMISNFGSLTGYSGLNGWRMR